MTLDARRLARILAERGPVARVVVAGARGSAPREAGAEMLVWANGQEGTIGGGALEWEAARAARAMLEASEGVLGGFPDGAGTAPSRGAPVGNRRAAAEAPAPPASARDVETVVRGASPDAARARDDAPASAPFRATVPGALDPAGGVQAVVDGTSREAAVVPSGAPPHATLRATASARALPAPRLSRHALGPELGQCCGGAVALVTEVLAEVPSGPDRALRLDGSAPRPPVGRGPTRIEGGWLLEPVTAEGEPLWIWGAGHVGRALVATLAPLDRFEIAWIDVAADRFPEGAPGRVVAADPPALAVRAPRGARHLIVTHSHAIDLALCHALLGAASPRAA